MNERYERHLYKNKTLPIIFHTDFVKTEAFHTAHWHENIEILFFEKGVGEVFVDHRVIRATKGDIVVINSEEIHCIRAISEEIVYICLIVDKSFCERVGFDIDKQHICTFIRDARIHQKILPVKKEFEAQELFYIPSVISKTVEILTELYRNYAFKGPKTFKSKNVEMVKSGMRYIKENFSKQITVEEIAKYTGYSKYYFCRCFKDITGLTVNAYTNSVKIERAMEYLETKALSVGQVSEACGFTDVSYFTKIFKKHTGILPSKVKNQ